MSRIKKDGKAESIDEYEADLEQNVDKAKPLSEKDKHSNMLQQASENYMKKDKRISIRVYGSDLDQIKRLAIREGLPYQTLITSVPHKFATGRFHKNEKLDGKFKFSLQHRSFS